MRAALASDTLFDAIGERLDRLIPRFGLEAERGRVRDAYGLICRESLALGLRERPPEFSRINVDGTPFQLSLALSPSRRSPLQFLGEVGTVAWSMGERMAASRERISALAELFGAAPELDLVTGLLERLAPAGHWALSQNCSGVYWLGVSFPPAGAPALTIYVNARWGSDSAQWERMRAFAAWFDGIEAWDSLEQRLRPHTAPLGTAITVAAGRPPTGRVYASAHRLPVGYYRSLLAGPCAEAAAQLVEAFKDKAGEHAIRPAVCSFEFRHEAGLIGAKFEICVHCALTSDAEAAARCLAWLLGEGADAGLYTSTVGILTGGRPLSSAGPLELHSYVGAGVHDGARYSSIYLNPGPPARAG